MRIKAFFLYIGLGAAFLAVSLWVFLSGGKNAKAIRAKYKLGGMMLTTWAMVSASTCTGPGPFVTCYEPAEPDPPEVMCYDMPAPTNEVHMESSTFKRGVAQEIIIDTPTTRDYLFQIKAEGNVLQQERITTTEEQDLEGGRVKIIFTPAEDLPEGEARFVVYAVYGTDNQGEEQLEQVCDYPITLE